MRLGLFERLGRLFGSRSGPRGGGADGGRGQCDPRAAGIDAGGRHRRNTGSGSAGEWPRIRPFAAQPSRPAQFAEPEWPTEPVQSPPWAPARPPVLPPMPRNYTPGAEGNGFGGNAVEGIGAGAIGRGGIGANGRAPGANGTARNGTGGHGAGAGRARIREAPGQAREVPTASAPVEMATRTPAGAELAHGESREPWYQVVGTSPTSTAHALARPDQSAAAPASAAATAAAIAAATPPTRPASQAVNGASGAQLPFAAPHPSGYRPRPDGRRHCGPLESILWRQWDATTSDPPMEVVAAIDRLAEFPRKLQEKLAAGLDGIYVGAGGVPDLDHMAGLHGVALPSGRATWDACAGAYGDRKIVVGTRPSPTPDVMCHEVGHALDDLDSPPGKWQSDSAEFRVIYDQCQPSIVSDFHRQRGGLGRKEFFADSFAAIASAQRPALVDMLGGNTRTALRVMLYFNRRYGI
jgi:hypothetical protein